MNSSEKFGKVYRIQLAGVVKANFDLYLQGKSVKLLGWAEDLKADTRYTQRQVDVILKVYSRRLLTDHLENAAYGQILEGTGKLAFDTVVLNLSEIIEI